MAPIRMKVSPHGWRPGLQIYRRYAAVVRCLNRANANIPPKVLFTAPSS